jgi:hypothetical protein
LDLFVPRLAQIDFDRVYPDWVAHFTGRKLKKYEAEKKEYEKSGQPYLLKRLKTVKVMVKTDEALFKVTDNMLEMKPRGISVVAAVVQLRTGPFVAEVQERLKKAWGSEGWTVPLEPHFSSRAFLPNGRLRRVLDKMRIYYACGWSDVQLSQWMHHVLRHRDETHILVSGDDGLIYNTLEESFDECDLTMCDQSQDVGFASFEKALNQRMGMPEFEAEVLKMTTEVPFLLEGKGPVSNSIKISRKARSERSTGGANTTNGNSIYTAVGHALVYGGFVKDHAALGMTIKMKRQLEWHQVTFLKGMWYPTTQGPFWGPLPSRFLKMPKSWRNPRELYPKRCYREASISFLSDLAKSFRPSLQVPLLRTFVENFADQRSRERDLTEPWQLVSFAGYRKPELTEDVWLYLNLRYGLLKRDFQEMEAMIPTAPFFFLSHPGFLKLALVDYA